MESTMSEREKTLEAALKVIANEADEIEHRLNVSPTKIRAARDICLHKARSILSQARAALALPPSPAPTRDYAKVGRGHGPKPSAITIHGDDLRLFEAAPDMLAALEMVESCFAPDDNDATAKAVRLAIARATGREG